MADYIDRQEFYNTEKLLNTDVVRKSKIASWLMDQFLHDIKASPTADVVEVVRCQNCAYSHKGCDSDMTKEIWCTYWQKTEGKAWNMMHLDDFCSHGAKKDLEEQK